MKSISKNLARVIFLVLLLISPKLAAQVTITAGLDWKDATLLKSLKPGDEAMANTNYGAYPLLSAQAWTSSGYQFTRRSLIRFELGFGIISCLMNS